MAVGLVLVSHSAKIADGLVELARQMAPSVALVAAGGTDDGRIGTSFEKVSGAIEEADTGDGVVILCDLGSAILTAEIAVDSLEDASEVRIADAPLVEGAVAAAVAAEGGGALDDVLAAAESAGGSARDEAPEEPQVPEESEQGGTDRASLINREGLHARPAAEFVKLANRFASEVFIRKDDVEVSGKSIMGVMMLAAECGSTVRIRAAGDDAQAAVEALAALVGGGFGEG